MNILEVQHLCKSYTIRKGYEQPVLSDINLQIRAGEFISVMGASGSGKSTLLYSISGMDQITSGKVLFEGQDLSGLSEKELSKLRRSKMGFIFQQIHLLNNLCVLDNIILSEYLAGTESREAIQQRARRLMEKAGIQHLAEREITQASGGQLQRVGICRALMNKPTIIFGDEPTGALNSKAAADIMELLGEINCSSGTTILLVTHDPKIAAKTERVVFLEDGKVAGELVLGKCTSSIADTALRERESQLAEWLLKMGN